MSVNGGVLWNDLLQFANWTSFHHVFYLLFVFQSANLSGVLRDLHEGMLITQKNLLLFLYLVLKARHVNGN